MLCFAVPHTKHGQLNSATGCSLVPKGILEGIAHISLPSPTAARRSVHVSCWTILPQGTGVKILSPCQIATQWKGMPGPLTCPAHWFRAALRQLAIWITWSTTRIHNIHNSVFLNLQEVHPLEASRDAGPYSLLGQGENPMLIHSNQTIFESTATEIKAWVRSCNWQDCHSKTKVLNTHYNQAQDAKQAANALGPPLPNMRSCHIFSWETTLHAYLCTTPCTFSTAVSSKKKQGL